MKSHHMITEKFKFKIVCSLTRKTIHSLKVYGVKTTWQRIKYRKKDIKSAMEYNKTPLFSDAELEEQRKHVFPKNLKFSIIVPLYNTPEVFLREMIDSVLAQTYGNLELCMADGSDDEHPEVEQICKEYEKIDSRICYKKLEENMGISGNTNACLDMVQGDYIGLFDHDDVLHPAALYEVMRAICELGADYIYTDESVFRKSPKDSYLYHLKPDFAPDNLRANNYICHFSVFKKDLLDKVGKFDPECNGSQDHDMILRLTEQAKKVVHIPEVLYHWRAHGGSVAENVGSKPYVFKAGIRAVERHLKRQGIKGEVGLVRDDVTIYRVRYELEGMPKVSIIVRNLEHKLEVNKCIDSIIDITTYKNYEIIILDYERKKDALSDYYQELQKKHSNIKVIKNEEKQNTPIVFNVGVKNCDGEYILFLDCNTKIVTPDWIQEMLMFSKRNDVGAVGSMIYDSNNNICQAGIGIGLMNLTGNLFRGVDRNHVGYMGRLLYAQNLSAVSSSCMMIKKSVWEEMEGFKTEYSANYYDIDLCLRMRKKGYLIVWTPFSQLKYLKREANKKRKSRKIKRQLTIDENLFRENWIEEIKKGDPYFNPNFAKNREDFFLNKSPVKWEIR